MGRIQIVTEGIKKSLGKYNIENAICEYIWNGFDAKATKVEIKFNKNRFGMATDLAIIDNGYGICKEKIEKKFKPFFKSEKEYDPNEKRVTSAVHGKNGVGRLTFFKFASSAYWETIYESNQKNYKYTISISENALESYYASEVEETNEKPGTLVKFKLKEDIFFDKIIDYIKKEFCWYLELNKKLNYTIHINDLQLDYTDIINDRDQFEYLSENDNNFKIHYVQWNEKINNEYSRYYFINSKDLEVHKDTTKLNKKADKFYHSIYIYSSFFDKGFPKDKIISGQMTIGLKKSRIDELEEMLANVNIFLKNKRKPFLKEYTDKLIMEYENDKVFPEFSNSLVDTYKKNELENVIRELYQVQPRIFSNLNKVQKPTFVRLLNLILEAGESDGLFEILSQIIELDEVERNDLAEVLKISKMDNVIKTIKLVQDRYKAIYDLREMVFDKDMKANEKYHLQKFIEKHYWIFGEKYNLVTAAEPKFEEALRRYIYILSGDDKKVQIDHPHKKKEMDIFAVRQNINSDSIDNIIVELKHPNVALGEKEYNQVKKYMNVITQQAEFNSKRSNWDFILVGNRFDKYGYINSEFDNAKQHGEKSLAFKSGNYKIYVKLWKEIFDEFEIRHNFINERLQLEKEKLYSNSKTADDIVLNENNTAIQSPEFKIAE